MKEQQKIEKIVKKTVCDFDAQKDMTRSFDDLGLDSLDKFGLVAEVEYDCQVSMPSRLAEKVNTVADIFVAVENLKRVKKANDTWVPCTYNGARQCYYMSDVPNTARRRATCGPDVSFCSRFACQLYDGKQR